MYCRLFVSLIFLFSITLVSGQAKTFKTYHGFWQITAYADNVIKVTLKPLHYSDDENITGAVIAKPLQQVKMPVYFSDNILYAGVKNKIALTAFVNYNDSNGFRIMLAGDEKIFGGGERALPINRRGYSFPLYNNPWYGYSNGADALNFSVPFFTSSKGYGLFFDNASKGYVDIGKSNSKYFDVGFTSGELNVYVIFGNDYKEILSSYYKLTGTQPLPPRWALGNFMSRFGYGSEAETKSIAQKMKDEHIPFDAIIFDLFWFGDSIKRTMGNLDWVNKTAWPDPKKMIGDFKKENIKSVLIAEPFVLENTKQYDFAKKYFAVDSAGKPFRLTDFYFGYGGLIDIFRKDAADAMWKHHYKKQLANGVTGWWTDLGEPEKHPSAIMHNLKSLGVKRLMGADEVHNIYGHYWNKMLFENYAKELPDERLFHLNRSGFAGSQRYSIFPWSGDVSRSWDGLKAQVPLMLGMSMSGIPYIHADAGGFAGGEGDNELYVRWLQFAAFTPVFRPHGTALFEKDPAAYSFPSEPALIDTPWRKYAKTVVKERYTMLPYNYTLSYKHATKGEPIVAPLYYYYPADTTVVNINDEYMFGENILVAPVIEKGISERKVYLPRGDWYAFKTNEIINGGGFQNVSLSINQIPVYIKSGSIIITSAKENISNTADDKSGELQIDYYTDNKPSKAEMYDDNGVSKNAIATKQFQLLGFSAQPYNAKIVFKINSRGSFKGMPAKRKMKFVIHGASGKFNKLFVNGKPVQDIIYLNGAAVFNINFTGNPINLEVR